ncbi:hypothetical protein HA402_005388 [Bradysia odoriphaga]|nr:hypothetical protein HA402_005388 [Bradysia odoriphaga]
MSIPECYTDIDLYLSDTLQFLKEFRWIFTTSNTEFIVHGILHQIPSEWVPTIDSLSLDELNEIPFDYIKESWPISLQTFLTRLKKLKPSIVEIPINSEQNHKEEPAFLRGIKPKKIHEIYKLSEEISRCCCDISNDSTVFVDLGCGVGHLTQFLHRKFQYKMLGIEADAERVKTARNIQKNKFPASQISVKFAEHFVGSDSASFLQSVSAKEFSLSASPDLILTGLHACADLTVDALNLFLRTANVDKLIIMPCCYHKMKLQENCIDQFENVPLSRRVKSAPFVEDIVNRPFLRLAGQQTAARWRNNTESEHTDHGRNMFVRGVIQAVLSEDETVIKSKQITSQSADCNCTLESILAQYTLIDKLTKEETMWSSSHKLKLENLLKTYPNGAVMSEFLTCLQASIQSICENLVVLDRLLYAKEEAAKLQLNVNISAKKIVNENISPRCFVIIAEKNK